ncbi:hypothetical protein TNCV_279871 [Trichonephila clavipes]|nr:hypothetical protein TNCV_279871 [Trichonephila clavipes]
MMSHSCSNEESSDDLEGQGNNTSTLLTACKELIYVTSNQQTTVTVIKADSAFIRKFNRHPLHSPMSLA